jgi:hypothetical protein
MLLNADDKGKVNVSRTKKHTKKEEERKKDRDENISIKKDKFTSSLTRGLAS